MDRQQLLEEIARCESSLSLGGTIPPGEALETIRWARRELAELDSKTGAGASGDYRKAHDDRARALDALERGAGGQRPGGAGRQSVSPPQRGRRALNAAELRKAADEAERKGNYRLGAMMRRTAIGQEGGQVAKRVEGADRKFTDREVMYG